MALSFHQTQEERMAYVLILLGLVSLLALPWKGEEASLVAGAYGLLRLVAERIAQRL